MPVAVESDESGPAIEANERAESGRAAPLKGVRDALAGRWRRYAVGAVVLLYALVFLRGLAWQWGGILSATRAAPPAVPAVPQGQALTAAPAVSGQSAVPAAPAANSGQAAAPAAPAPGAAAAPANARVPLPPTDAPPPRNAADDRGVFYDADGVAVMGIDADPSGVYNVPSGRQVRIGGPTGQLYDVGPGGKLTPATKLKTFP